MIYSTHSLHPMSSNMNPITQASRRQRLIRPVRVLFTPRGLEVFIVPTVLTSVPVSNTAAWKGPEACVRFKEHVQNGKNGISVWLVGSKCRRHYCLACSHICIITYTEEWTPNTHTSSGRAILSRTINNDNLKVVLLSRHIFSLIAVNF